jgi:hypothetical protein
MGGEILEMYCAYSGSTEDYYIKLDIEPKDIAPLTCGGRAIAYTSFLLSSLLAKNIALAWENKPIEHYTVNFDFKYFTFFTHA